MKDFLNSWGLSLAIFVPVLGAVVMLFIPKAQEHLHKVVALVTSLVVALVGVLLLANFDYDAGDTLQFVETLTTWSDEMLRLKPDTLMKALGIGAKISQTVRRKSSK